MRLRLARVKASSWGMSRVVHKAADMLAAMTAWNLLHIDEALLVVAKPAGTRRKQ